MVKTKRERKAKIVKPKKVRLVKPKRVKLVKCFWCDQKVSEDRAIATNGKWYLPKASNLCRDCNTHLDGIFHPWPKAEEPKIEEPRTGDSAKREAEAIFNAVKGDLQ